MLSMERSNKMSLPGRTKYCMGKYGHEGEEIYSAKEAARLQQAVFRQIMSNNTGRKGGKKKGGKRR